MKTVFRNSPSISSNVIIIVVAFFIILFGNAAFFSHVLDTYPLTLKNSGFLVSLVWVFTGFTVLLLSIVSYKYTIKTVLITILMISSFVSYFMDSYNTVIDTSMIHNTLHTDTAESLDLLSLKLIVYVVLLGLIPSLLVFKMPISMGSGWQEIKSRLKLFSLTLLSILAVIYLFSDFYSSFFREHKQLRYYSNPGFYIYSSGKYLGSLVKSQNQPLSQIGTDAKVPVTDIERELVIFVVGETARADRFSLNGYDRETNPLLSKQSVVSFTDFWSCGTSTAISVPCMFSIYNTTEFDVDKGNSTENVLDVLKHAGVNLLWLDNNSSSKGVADRIDYQSFKGAETNPDCDFECRDTGMLKNLQTYIDGHPEGDIFIVLHQMGQHGPAYYKRYPAEFKKFTPVCETNQLENCSEEELNNAYDNAILYTDYFLSEVIDILKLNDNGFETAMIYVSDHGESLGESGLYLHGLPNFIAPDSQRHVPAIVWLGKNMADVDLAKITSDRNNKYSHDNIFHSILGLLEIETPLYDKKMDFLQHPEQYE